VWDKDLLHVTYDAGKITVDQIVQAIQNEGFEKEAIRIEAKP